MKKAAVTKSTAKSAPKVSTKGVSQSKVNQAAKKVVGNKTPDLNQAQTHVAPAPVAPVTNDGSNNSSNSSEV